MIISIIENKIKINFDEFSKEFQEFRRKQSLENDIEDLKFQAFQQFLKQYELIQTNSLMKCSIKVKEILKKKLDSLKETMKINLGFDFNCFQLISNLLKRVIIYYSCCSLPLPLLEFSMEFSKLVEDNSVITIRTSTGSGLFPHINNKLYNPFVIVTRKLRVNIS